MNIRTLTSNVGCQENTLSNVLSSILFILRICCQISCSASPPINTRHLKLVQDEILNPNWTTIDVAFLSSASLQTVISSLKGAWIKISNHSSGFRLPIEPSYLEHIRNGYQILYFYHIPLCGGNCRIHHYSFYHDHKFPDDVWLLFWYPQHNQLIRCRHLAA